MPTKNKTLNPIINLGDCIDLGPSIFSACENACKIAEKKYAPVHFIFNEIRLEARAGYNPKQVEAVYWLKQKLLDNITKTDSKILIAQYIKYTI